MFLESWSNICGSCAWDGNTPLSYIKTNMCNSTARSRRRNWHAWPGCCGEWVLCAAGCWNATSLFSSCHQTWTPGTDGPPHTPEETSRELHTHTKIITLNITLNNTHLSEHGFAVLRDHSTLIAVQRHEVVVERLFRVFQDVVELVSAALKHTPEVTRNQRPTDRWRETITHPSEKEINSTLKVFWKSFTKCHNIMSSEIVLLWNWMSHLWWNKSNSVPLFELFFIVRHRDVNIRSERLICDTHCIVSDRPPDKMW